MVSSCESQVGTLNDLAGPCPARPARTYVTDAKQAKELHSQFTSRLFSLQVYGNVNCTAWEEVFHSKFFGLHFA